MGNVFYNFVALHIAAQVVKRTTNTGIRYKKVEPSSTSWNMSLQFARLNIVARQVSQASGNTGNDAFQLAKKRCCATSCKKN